MTPAPQSDEQSTTPFGKVTSVEATHRLYDFHLAQPDFVALCKAERERIVPVETWVANSLERSPEAKERGLDGLSVDFDHRFEASISILIDVQHDTPETHAFIARVISERVEAAHAALAGVDD
jgi:hypothetical protein